MSNKKTMLFVMTLMVLLVGISAASAADTSSDDSSVATDTPVVSDDSSVSSADTTPTQATDSGSSTTSSSSSSSQSSSDSSTSSQSSSSGSSSSTDVVKTSTSSSSSSASKDVSTTTSSSTNDADTQASTDSSAVTTKDTTNTVDSKTLKQDGDIHKITVDSFDDFFDNGMLTDIVNEGDTLDFIEPLQSDDTHNYTMTINKPVNIISSNGQSNISLNTSSTDFFGQSPGDSFTITEEGSGTNVTGIYFYNTQIFVRTASDVVFDNITCINENKVVGGGVGVLSIREGSKYVTVKNSYFRTEANGGHSTLVLADADYCVFDNNTIDGYMGANQIGNIIYLTTYNVDVEDYSTVNQYNNITNNVITVLDGQSSTCWGITIAGGNNIVANNTINTLGVGITTQYGSGTSDEAGASIPSLNNQYYGNVVSASTITIPTNSIVDGNDFTTTGLTTIYSGTTLTNNNLSYVAPVGVVTFENNNITGNVTLSMQSEDVTTDINFKDNNIDCDVIFAKSSTGGVIQNINFEGNTIVGDIVTGDTQLRNYVTLQNVTIKANEINGTIKLSQTSNQEVSDVTIEDNIIYSLEDYAITLGEKTSDITIINNEISSILAGGNNAVYSESNDPSSIIVENNTGDTLDIGVVSLDPISDVTVGSTVTITGTLTLKDEPLDGEITLTINNEEIPITTQDGKFTYDYLADVAGTVNVVATYAGNEEIVGSTATATFNVKKTETTITVTDAEGKYNKETKLTATILDSEGNPVNDGRVVFKLNGVTIKDEEGNQLYAQVEDGIATLDYTVINNIGTYTITATYSGSDEYESARTTDDATLTVVAGKVDLTIQTVTEGLKGGDTTVFTVIVADEDGAVDDGIVIFKLNGVTIKNADGGNLNATVVNGVATIEYTIPVDMAGKDYTLTAVYSGKNYERAEANETLSLIKQNVTANIDPIVINQGEDTTISVTLYDQNGNQLERSTKVAVKVNGKTFENTNTENGVLDVTIPTSDFKNPVYNVTIIFGENSAYNQLVLETTLTVNEATNLINITMLKVTESQNGTIIKE